MGTNLEAGEIKDELTFLVSWLLEFRDINFYIIIMSDAPGDVMMLTYNVFRPKAEAKRGQLHADMQDLFTDPQNMTIERLLNHCGTYRNDMDLLNFSLGLLVIKLSRESPLPNNSGLEMFPWVQYFIANNTPHAVAIISSYISPLIQEISEATRQTLKAWGNILKSLGDLGGNIEDAKQWLQIRYTAECSSMLSILYENPSQPNINTVIELLIDSQEVGVDVTIMKGMCINAICTFIINQNDLKGIRALGGEQVNQDINMARQILSMVKLLNGIESEEKELIDFIETKIGVVNVAASTGSPKKIPKKQKMSPGQEQLLNLPGLDLSTVVYDEFELCAKQHAGIHISVRKGKFPNGSQIAVKTYSKLVATADLSSVQDEIDVLTILSNRATSENCFIKFYGAFSQGSSISLCMEAHSFNLMDILTHWKTVHHRPENRLLEGWIYSLVTAFADLSNLKIYHCDIKPHNIIVTDTQKLKIIDFGVSKISKEMEATLSPTCSFPIQGTKGYMSPELEEMLAKKQVKGDYKPGKSDVFSLGLTLLQMITQDDLTSMNIKDKNPMLIGIVDGLQMSHWVKNLLKAMLILDRKARLSFNKCLRYLPAIDSIIQ